MAPFVGKSGSDAIFRAMNRICIVVQKYNAKLHLAIAAAVTAGLLTSAQGTLLDTFVDTARATCDLWAIVAGNSGFPGL